MDVHTNITYQYIITCSDNIVHRLYGQVINRTSTDVNLQLLTFNKCLLQHLMFVTWHTSLCSKIYILNLSLILKLNTFEGLFKSVHSFSDYVMQCGVSVVYGVLIMITLG